MGIAYERGGTVRGNRWGKTQCPGASNSGELLPPPLGIKEPREGEVLEPRHCLTWLWPSGKGQVIARLHSSRGNQEVKYSDLPFLPPCAVLVTSPFGQTSWRRGLITTVHKGELSRAQSRVESGCGGTSEGYPFSTYTSTAGLSVNQYTVGISH